MEEVYLVAVAREPAVKATPLDVADLAARAIVPLFDSANVDPADVSALYLGNMLSGLLSNQQLLAPLVAQKSGLQGVEALTVEAACGSGAAAIRAGFLAVASGAHARVVVAGVEKMSGVDRNTVSRALACASHWATEGGAGETFITLNAKIMRQYMARYHLERAAFAPFAVNAHRNGLHNDCAMLKKSITHADYLAARELAEPIGLYDAPPICDGAAAVLLGNRATAHAARARGLPMVKITGSGCASDALALAERDNPLALQAAADSALAAYRQAGKTPADIDLFEPHDAYTVMTALSLEAAGFADRGKATEAALAGSFDMDGALPITTFGGLKARGHPVGATGVYQIAECFLQLTDQAGLLQVANARVAMAQNLGGAAGSAFTHILERV
ncbi:hypothetical protein L1F30_15835 [Simiduia sp. 21SJ11W-1]|uniref:thiolase C-terminal domain-containing protein n=1 Tax=Simiduia sp. 21SJ11W-1 TaxID=2909669 RepID=UPI0020A1AD0F|nr:hypothetical protein [Simiduia sp. 21SJ11W-1]UTA47613.1 hypothetical protein L1F30_15835 [Simiduia sp. 21SJ11W-1]